MALNKEVLKEFFRLKGAELSLWAPGAVLMAILIPVVSAGALAVFFVAGTVGSCAFHLFAPSVYSSLRGSADAGVIATLGFRITFGITVVVWSLLFWSVIIGVRSLFRSLRRTYRLAARNVQRDESLEVTGHGDHRSF